MFKGFLAAATAVMLMMMVAFLMVQLDQHSSAKADTVVIDKTNLVVLASEVNSKSVHDVMEKAHELDQDAEAILKKSPIYLFLLTPGGDVQAGENLAVYLSGLRRPVHTITLFAASMGFHLVQQLGTRYILENGTLMSHRARGGVQGEFGGLDGSQFDQRYAFYKARFAELDAQVVRRTKGKQTMSSYLSAYENEMWRTGSQAIEQGYADEIISVRCGETGPAITFPVSFMGMQINVKMSSCPLDGFIEADTTGLTEEEKNKIPTDIVQMNRIISATL